MQTKVKVIKAKQLSTCSQMTVRSYTRASCPVFTRRNGFTTLVIWNSGNHALMYRLWPGMLEIVIAGFIELPYRSRSGSLVIDCSAVDRKLFRRLHRSNSGGRNASLNRLDRTAAVTLQYLSSFMRFRSLGTIVSISVYGL